MNCWVVDTNVVCAGLITGNQQSPTAQIVDLMLSGKASHVVSLLLLNEYERVLSRPALARLHRLTASDVEALVANLARHAVLMQGPSSKMAAPEPGDQHLWDLLVAYRTLRLVTGDKRLLDDGPMTGRVLTPAQALTELQA